MSKSKADIGNALRPSEIAACVKIAMKVKRPAFIWGPPGIGKSDLMLSISGEQKRPLIDIRLLLLEPTDLKGIPFYNPAEETMTWAASAELPEKLSDEMIKGRVNAAEARLQEIEKMPEGLDKQRAIEDIERRMAKNAALPGLQNAILFLDELNAAPQSVQAASYQLMLNRRIGEYLLPDGVSIVAAGNRMTDKGVTFQMPSPLRNRLIHLEMESNFDDWQAWAINSGEVHPDVVGFLTAHKSKLFDFDPKSPEHAFATPRTWVYASDLVREFDQTHVGEHILTSLIGGTVGRGKAYEFMQHRRVASKMPAPEDILFGRVKTLEVDEMSARFSLIISLCYTLKEWAGYMDKEGKAPSGYDTKGGKVEYTDKEWHENFDNFLAYIMKNLSPEMIILGAKTAVRDYDLPIQHKKLKEFSNFNKEYGKFIIE